MSERLFQRPKSTKDNYGKLRFLIDSPKELQDIMRQRINQQIHQLHHKHVNHVITAFQLPQELHFIPLYEQLLFESLIKYHNTYSTPNRFVYPPTFMLLDKNTSNYIPLSTGARLPMELASDHEAKHWFELEANNEHLNGPNTILYRLYWKKVQGEIYEALMLEAMQESRVRNSSPHIMSIMLAPNYPSDTDFANLKFATSKMKTHQRLFNSIKAFFLLRSKAFEQGLPIYKSPISLSDARDAIYLKWMENNANRIRMDVFP